MSSKQIQPNAPGLPLVGDECTMSDFHLPRTKSINKAIRGAADRMTSEWLTAAEAAELLRVKHRTILKWAKSGQIPAHRLSGSERVIW